MDFDLIQARPADAQVLQNLFQLYAHDFSSFWAGQARGELGEDGRFEPYALDGYFLRPAWQPFLIRAGGALAGFALVNDEPHSGLPADRSMAEFFIVRKHRRTGLGRRSAERLFHVAPGVWEVAVARANVRAQTFWRNVIGTCAAPGSTSELNLSGPDWNGPVFRFRVEVADSPDVGSVGTLWIDYFPLPASVVQSA